MQLELGQPVDILVTSKQFPQLGYSQTIQDRTGRAASALARAMLTSPVGRRRRGRGLAAASDTYATVFFFCGIMFQYNVLLYNICMEKDLQLRRGLRMVGLKVGCEAPGPPARPLAARCRRHR